MWKRILTTGFVLAVFMPVITVTQVIKVASLYGVNTQIDDVYKQIMDDASTYINDERSVRPILQPGDQININHEKVLEDRAYETQSLSKTVYRICSILSSAEASAVILPNDFCDNCDDLGAVIGEAYSPVLTIDQADGSGAFKMRPNLDDLEEMITDVIKNFKWSTFIFLHQGDVAFGMVESMMARAIKYGWTVTPIEFHSADHFESQTKMLKNIRVKNILVYFTDEDLLKGAIDVAFETKLLSNGWHWMFGNLNPPISKSFLDQKYRHNMAFLTRFKVVSNELLYYSSISTPIKLWRFRQRAAYDAVVAIGMAMNLHKQSVGRFPDVITQCGSSQRSELEPYLKQVSFRGASGDVAFNDKGDRVNYTINIYSGKDTYAQNLIGYFAQDVRGWEIANREKWPGKAGMRTYLKPYRQSDARFIKILVVPEPPFFMEKGWEADRYRSDHFTAEEIATKNDEPYQGYAWELLKEVKKVFEEEMEIDFTFQITLMGRGQYGTLDLSTGEWNGMIRELMDGDADVAIGSLTKNSAREKDIDFTGKWYSSQLKMVILHPSWTYEYPFALIYPFKMTAWFALITFFLFISVVIMFVGHFNPYEWRNRAQRGEASEEEGETFGIRNSLFYVLSTAFWQGYNRGPRSWSMRILSGFWFFFALCIIFLYANNLNQVLKFSKTAIKINDVHDLLYNDNLDFGAIRNSPAFDFYRYNKGDYRMVFDRILNSEKNVIENRVEEGMYRIRRQWDGRYAILGEERILKYAADRRPCRLFITGKTFGKISFSFATPSGSPLRDQLSYALKVLKKRGNITRILDMEFSDRLGCSGASTWETQTKKSFTTHDLQGLYYMLLIGIAGSLAVFILECLVYALVFDEGWKNKSKVRGNRKRSPATELQTDYHDSRNQDGGAGDNVPTDWI